MAALPISIHNVNTRGGRRLVNRVCTSSVAAAWASLAVSGSSFATEGKSGVEADMVCCVMRGSSSHANDQRQPSPPPLLCCAWETACVRSHHSCSQKGSPSPPRMDRHGCRRCAFERCASADVHSLGFGRVCARDAAFFEQTRTV